MFNISAFFNKGSSREKVHYDPETRRMAKDAYERGRGLLDAALGGMDALDGDFSAQIAGGGLTPEMEREYEVQRGQVADLVAKSRRSYGADLLQAARRTGGTVDANTALAFQLEREGDLDEASFSANNEISFKKASARMERTDRLYNQILEIRAKKAGLSQAERDRAMQMWLGAVSGRTVHTRNYGASGGMGSTAAAPAAGAGYPGVG